jgi:hypothetical protein
MTYTLIVILMQIMSIVDMTTANEKYLSSSAYAKQINRTHNQNSEDRSMHSSRISVLKESS